jgi:PiT family inorganic phosphate transporter
MDAISPTVILVFVAAFYMAWNIGANDLANSMGDVVGARVLNLRQIVLVAGCMTFLGAALFGSRVTTTIAEGIIPISQIDQQLVTGGGLASLLAAGIWITIATYFRLPVSTSHSIVGAVLGFGLVIANAGIIKFGDIAWAVLLRIVFSWILSPIAGMFLAFLVFTLIRRALIERVRDVRRLEKIFGFLLICSSCYIAFSLGTNDVANAVGSLSAALGKTGMQIPVWILAFGGFGIVLGISTWGYRVVETIGKRITELTPTRGFSADISTATVVLVCSTFGLPVSTTHTLVGAIVGVGLARGLDAVNLAIIRRIVYSWLITVPASTALAIIIYLGFWG